MVSKKFCAIFTGIADLVYAVALTGLIGYIVYWGIHSLFYVGNGGSTGNSGVGVLGLIFAGPFVMVFYIVLLIIALIPCIALWVTSIGLISAGAKSELPSGFGIGSAIVNGLIAVVLVMYIVYLYQSGAEDAGMLIAIAVGGIVLSVVLLVTSIIAGAGNSKAKMRRYEPRQDIPPADGSKYFYNGDGGYNAYGQNTPNQNAPDDKNE